MASAITEYKKTIAELATRIVCQRRCSVEAAVSLAMEIVDEVERAVNRELETTGYEIGL
jgi:hypothetical protein